MCDEVFVLLRSGFGNLGSKAVAVGFCYALILPLSKWNVCCTSLSQPQLPRKGDIPQDVGSLPSLPGIEHPCSFSERRGSAGMTVDDNWTG